MVNFATKIPVSKRFSIPAAIVLVLSCAFPVLAQHSTEGITSKVDYVGTHDVRLVVSRIQHRDGYTQYPENGVRQTYHVKDVTISFLRYRAGESVTTAHKRGEISFQFGDPQWLPPINWYDEGTFEAGVTYQYTVKAVFRYDIEEDHYIDNKWVYSKTLLNEPIAYGDPNGVGVSGSATGGRVWGDVLRDTTWSGAIEVDNFVTVGGHPHPGYQHNLGVTLTVSPSSVITTGNIPPWDDGYSIIINESRLLASDVTFDGTTAKTSISYTGSAQSGAIPPVDIQNSVFTGQLALGGNSGRIVFQGNSGDALGEITVWPDPATPFIFSENNLPGVQLLVRYPDESSPVETRIENNTLKSIDILGRQVEQPPAADWSVSITGNVLSGYESDYYMGTLMVRGLQGARSLVIEGNEITGLGSMSVEGPAWWVEDGVNDWPSADEEAFFVIKSNTGFHTISVMHAPGGRIENNERVERILVQNIGGAQPVLIKGNIFPEDDTSWQYRIGVKDVERGGALFHIEENLNIREISVDNVPGVVIRNNEIIGNPHGDCGIIVKNFSGARGAVVEGNTFGVGHAVIEVRDSDQHEKEGVFIRGNMNVAKIALYHVTGAVLEDNEIGTDGGIYTTPPHGIEIQESHHNLIRNNTLRLPEDKIPGQHHAAGILVGLYPNSHQDDSGIVTPRATHNQITGNRIENYNYGIGLGSAADTVITGNTFRDNYYCMHLGPIRNRWGNITHIAYPSGNQIRNNAFYHNTRYYLPGHVRIIEEPSAAIHNTWFGAKTEGVNIVGGPYLGGNFWSRYDGIDTYGDGIGDTWYYPTGVQDYWNRDERPLVKFALLQLSAAALNPSDTAEFYGITGEYDYENGAENIPVIHVTLAASDLDDWEVTSLTFKAEGTGNEREDVIAARLYLENTGGTLLGTKDFAEGDGEITFTFDPAVTIEKGTSKSFLLVYDFRPERAWPCNGYGARIVMGGVSAEAVTEAHRPGSKFPPDDPVIGGPSRVKRGILVKQEGSDGQFGQADIPEAANAPLANPLKVRLARQHPASVEHVSFRVLSPAAIGGFLDGTPGERYVEKPMDADGYAEASLTLGTRKGLQNPYDVEFDMSVKGDGCGSWAKPSFRAFGMGLEYETEARYDNPDNANLFGTYLSHIEAENRFTLKITDMAPPGSIEIREVRFTLGGQTVVATEVTKNVEYYADFDMSRFDSSQKMLVTIVMEKDGSTVEQTAEYDVKVLKLPGWVSIVEAIAHPESFSMEFSDDDGGTYNFSFTYPTNFMWSDTIPGDVGFLGGLGNDLDIEFTAEAAYRVDETSVFGAVITGEPKILGYEFGLEGGLSGEFDSNFAFQRGSGMVRAEFGFDLPSKGYSRTFLIYGVPITAAVDLSGNVDIFIRGGAVLNRQVEFEEVTIAPGTTVTGHITVSLSAVFGLAKIAATGSPTATVEIEIRYTTADGTTTTWRGEVAVPITVVGSIFWGLGSAELYSTTLGPWTFGDGGSAPMAFRPLGDLPTPAAPRLLTASALAADGEGRRMSVWIGDTTPEADKPDPDVFFRYFDGSSWTAPAPVIGFDNSPNDEWEMDPAAVFMAGGRALSCWTANRGDKTLDSLNAIFAAQEIVCAVWDMYESVWGWGDPVYLTDDAFADGVVSLAYGGGNAVAVWVHSADGVDVLDRTAWELRYARYDEGTGQWYAPAPVTGTNGGYSDQMPSVSAGTGGVVLVWARDDDGVFYTENEPGPDGEPRVINGTTIASEDNEDSRIMWSRWEDTGWTAPAYVATGGKATRLFPSLAASPDGRFLAVWTEKEPGKKASIKYSVLSGTDWSTPGTVAESDQFLEEPKAVVSASGRATVIWRGYAAGGNALFSSSTPGLTAPEWSEPERITHDTTVQWQPVAVVAIVDEEERVVASWTAYDAVTWQDQPGPGLTGGLNVAVVNPGTAELTGVYGVALPDADQDGFYDGIVFSVEVEINKAGAYQVRGELYAGSKHIAGASHLRENLSAGTHTFLLTFPGGLISNRGLDGPYSLKNVVLIDRSGSAVTTDSVSTAVTTDAYGASRFAPGPLGLDKALYVGTLDQAVITVKDPALNKDPEKVEIVHVRVTSTGDRKGFDLALMETGADTGVFRGTLGFSLTGSSAASRRILVSDQTRIEVIYRDETGVNWSEDALWTAGGAADVNGDGVVDLADVILALQIITESAPPGTELNRAAALSGDKRIGAAVAVHILRELAAD